MSSCKVLSSPSSAYKKSRMGPECYTAVIQSNRIAVNAGMRDIFHLLRLHSQTPFGYGQYSISCAAEP